MTYNGLASLLAKREGKKKSLSIAQIKEVLSLMADYVRELDADDPAKLEKLKDMLISVSKKSRRKKK